jgi:hypothetical protein
VDTRLIESFRARRLELKQQFIDECAGGRRIYPNGRFNRSQLFGWADEEHIGMPRHTDGSPILKRHTLKKVAQFEPRVAPFAQLRADLSRIENFGVPIRSDGRIRPNYKPFRTQTSRNAPGASANLMLQARWTRGFLLAPPGYALTQLDYKCQEIFIAAVMSGDHQLLGDLEGDPYLQLAIRSGLAPAGATADSHPGIRDKCKIALLSLIYGAGAQTLAASLDVELSKAQAIKRSFESGYPDLCEWLDDVVRAAYATLRLESPLGWPLIVGPRHDPYTLRNHIIQAAGADVLRMACLLAQDAGCNVTTTLHDSVLLEEKVEIVQARAELMAHLMSRAAELVIGYPIPAKTEFIAQRYQLKGDAKTFFENIVHRLGMDQATG